MKLIAILGAIVLMLLPQVALAQYYNRHHPGYHPHHYSPRYNRPRYDNRHHYRDNSAAIGLGLGLGILGLMVGGAIVSQDNNTRDCSNVVTGIDRYGREIRENICE